MFSATRTYSYFNQPLHGAELIEPWFLFPVQNTCEHRIKMYWKRLFVQNQITS